MQTRTLPLTAALLASLALTTLTGCGTHSNGVPIPAGMKVASPQAVAAAAARDKAPIAAKQQRRPWH